MSGSLPRVGIEPDLRLPGHPEIAVIGDLASARSHAGRGKPEPKPVPGVSPAAKQVGRAAAANLLLDWGWAYWTYERSARVVAQPPSRTP